jgi:hypothetical protein
VLIVVATAYPRRSLAPTSCADQAPQFQSADIALGPPSGSPAAIAATSAARPVAAASGAAAVVAPASVAAVKPPAKASAPEEPSAAKKAASPARPTWSELTRHLNSPGGSPESADASASIDANGDAGSGVREAIAASEAAALGVPVVTLTGCLEMSTDRQDFRLSDTEGTDAPKSRSWRSGFLQKRSTPVALDAPGSFALQGDVGKRVAATGVLSGRALTLQSLRVVSTSCD